MNQEIITREVERTLDDRMIVHLYQEGSFYRAYEWSAWLCHRFINQFKVTHRHFKNIEQSVLFVGFLVTSLPKYVAEGAVVYDVALIL